MTLLITLLKSATSSTNLNQKFYKSFQIRIFQDCPSGTSTGSFSQPVSPTNLPGCFSTYLSLLSGYHQISCPCYRVITKYLVVNSHLVVQELSYTVLHSSGPSPTQTFWANVLKQSTLFLKFCLYFLLHFKKLDLWQIKDFTFSMGR